MIRILIVCSLHFACCVVFASYCYVLDCKQISTQITLLVFFLSSKLVAVQCQTVYQSCCGLLLPIRASCTCRVSAYRIILQQYLIGHQFSLLDVYCLQVAMFNQLAWLLITRSSCNDVTPGALSTVVYEKLANYQLLLSLQVKHNRRKLTGADCTPASPQSAVAHF